ncbi:MAG: CDP-alcohol phosphatidyltransferase family protein [Mycobacteriaceae bacterium]
MGEGDWSSTHSGIDPSGVPLLRGWLLGVEWLARPLVSARVPPDAVTLVGGLSALAVPVLVRRGRLRPAIGAVLASVVLDGLDGAVARGSGRVSAHGRTLDSSVDRLAEAAWWWALSLVEVPRPVVAALAVISVSMETWRAHSDRHGRLTVWERPTRTILVVAGLASAGPDPVLAVRAVPARAVPRVTGLVGLVLALVGGGQLLWAVRTGSIRAAESG